MQEARVARSGLSTLMAKKKDDCIEMEGIVTESLPNAMFRVELEANQQVRRSVPTCENRCYTEPHSDSCA